MSISYHSKFSAAGILLILATSSLLLSSPSWGKSAKEKKIEQNRTTRDKKYDLIRELNQDEQLAKTILATLDAKIQALENEIHSIKEQFDQANFEKERLEGEKTNLEDELANFKSNLKQRIRGIYMQGELTYLDLVFQATSFGDAIDRLYFVQTIVERDKSLVRDASLSQEALAGKISQIDGQITEIDRIKQALESQQVEIEATRGEKQLTIAAINNDQVLFERQIKILEEVNKKIMQEIRDEAKSASKWNKEWTDNFDEPCKGSITSGYGMRKHPILGVKKMHTGVDIGAPKGTRVSVGGEGKVIFTGIKRGYGKTVIVDHGNNRTTLYAHLSKISCKAGQPLQKGAKVGEVGSTGYSTGNHLHFEVRIKGATVDPLKHLD